MIRADALLTCMENSQVSASTFEVVFTPSNGSFTFNINAITTLQGYFVAKVTVVAYGIDIISETVDLCSIGAASADICPLSPGRIDNLRGSETLSSSIVKEIPSIAYTVPNLDGIVRVIVYERNQTAANPVACVEATLTNGRTVTTKIASWVLAVITILGFMLAGVAWLRGSLSSSAHIAANIVSLFVYFQSVAIIAMMAVERCPPMAAAWSQNFVWTVGLISIPFMQNIFNWYIQSSGGTVTDILPNKDIMSISIQKRDQIFSFAGDQLRTIYDTIQDPDSRARPFALAAGQLIPRDVAHFMQIPSLRKAFNLASFATDTSMRLLARAESDDEQTSNETTNERSPNFASQVLVLRGIQRVAFLANIEITSLFVTGLTFFVIIVVFTMIVLSLMLLFTQLLASTNVIKRGRLTDFRKSWRSIVKGILLRLYLMAFPSLTVLCLWEFTQHESASTVVLAIVAYATVLAMLGFGCFKTISLARLSMQRHKNHAYILYSDPVVFNRWGFLYIQFRASAYYFVAPLLIYIFLKGLFIAVAQSSGKAQALCVFIVELAYLIYISITKPYMDKTTNGFNIAISAINLVNALFFLFFSNLFGQPAYVSSIMGVIFFVANAAFSLVLVIMIIIACVWAMLSRNPETRYQPMADDRESFIPDSQGEKKPITELDALGASARDGFPSEEGLAELSSTKPSSVFGDSYDGDDVQTLDSRPYYRDDSGEMVRGSASMSNSSLIPGQGLPGRTPFGDSARASPVPTNSSSNFPSTRLPRSGGSSNNVQEYPGYNEDTSYRSYGDASSKYQPSDYTRPNQNVGHHDLGSRNEYQGRGPY